MVHVRGSVRCYFILNFEAKVIAIKLRPWDYSIFDLSVYNHHGFEGTSLVISSDLALKTILYCIFSIEMPSPWNLISLDLICLTTLRSTN